MADETVQTLVFNNADATPKTVALRVTAQAVPDIMEWYGAFFAGDRYTVALDGRNIPMGINGEALSNDFAPAQQEPRRE